MSHVNVDVDKMKTENESPCINSATEQPLPGATRSQFPYKLHRVLNDALDLGFDDIIAWMPHGKSFRVFSKERLEEEVMARYFDSKKFKTFQRNLNLWGFQVGENKEIVQEFFIRGRPDLCEQMQRVKVKGDYVRGTRCYSTNRSSPSSKHSTSTGHHYHHRQPSVCTACVPPEMKVCGTPKFPSASTGQWHEFHRPRSAHGNACHHRSDQESLLNLIASANRAIVNQDTHYSLNYGLINGQYDQQQWNAVQTAPLMSITSSEAFFPSNVKPRPTQLQNNHQLETILTSEAFPTSSFPLIPRPLEKKLAEAAKMKLLSDFLSSKSSVSPVAPFHQESQIDAWVRALIPAREGIKDHEWSSSFLLFVVHETQESTTPPTSTIGNV